MVAIAILMDFAVAVQAIAMEILMHCLFVVLEDIKQLRRWKCLRTIETIELLEMTLITEPHVHSIGTIVFRWHCDGLSIFFFIAKS